MKELSKEERERRAHNYAAMMSSEAWKDLVSYAESERQDSVKRVDEKAAWELNLGAVCEERGIRKGLQKLIQHAEFCREGI